MFKVKSYQNVSYYDYIGLKFLPNYNEKCYIKQEFETDLSYRQNSLKN